MIKFLSMKTRKIILLKYVGRGYCVQNHDRFYFKCAKCELSAEHSHKDAKERSKAEPHQSMTGNTDPSFNQTSEISSHVFVAYF